MDNKISSILNQATLWLLAAAAFSINLPIAFGSTCILLFLIFWLISGGYSIKLNLISRNWGALIALGFLGFYGLGVFYSSAPWNESVHYFLKYSKLLLIPLIAAVFVNDQYRNYALNAFLISLIGYLMVSYLNWLGFFSFGVMRHGTYLSVGLYLMLIRARKLSGIYRGVWLTLSAVTAFNILVIADVRTAVITMFALLILFSYENWGWKSLMYWFGAFLIGVFIIKSVPSVMSISPRLANIPHEISAHRSNVYGYSAGMRLEMYKNTLELIKKHPIFGGGTGSLEGEYAQLIRGTDAALVRVTNPHNQFLATTQDLGVIGLVVLVLFWGTHWRLSYELSGDHNRWALRGLVLATAVGSLFNSLLLDGGDGRMYCILAGVLLSSYSPRNAK